MHNILTTAYLIWIGLLLVLAVVIIASFVNNYRKENGSNIFQRAKAATLDSYTMLWARFQVVVLGAVNGIAALAAFLRDPDLSNAISQYADPQTVKIVSYVLLFSIAVTVFARRQSLAK